MSIQDQVHDKFKLFVGDSVSSISMQIEAFTTGGKVAAKSIGVEHLDASGRLLVSLGYADGQAGYKVSLHAASLGKLDPSNFAGLEASMEKAAAHAKNVICQELFANAVGELTMVFLTHVG